MTVAADHPARTHRAEWRALREAVLARAGNRCECDGICGCDHPGDLAANYCCLAPHGAMIVRDRGMPSLWMLWTEHAHRALCACGGPVRVVLTLAHLDAEGGPCRCSPPCLLPEHVLALCQRCHLRYDRDRHRRSAARTRRARNLTLPGIAP